MTTYLDDLAAERREVARLTEENRVLTERLDAAQEEFGTMVTSNVMMNRIIDACASLRAEYNAKLVKKHEEHMVELNRIRNEHRKQLDSIRKRLLQMWVD